MYLSYVLGQSIKDPEGRELGKLEDLVASPAPHLPVISAVVVRTGRGQVRNVVWECFRYDEDTERFSLAGPVDEVKDYTFTDEDLLLKTNVMDKQIVDVHDYRVVRVNDVRIEPSGDRLYLVGVDTGMRGLLRRMGLMHVADSIGRLFKIRPSSQVIAWHDVETFERGLGRLKLKVSAERLSALHPSDIALILNELDPDQRTEVMQSLDLETAAEVLTEAHPEVQASIVENLEDERAADILEEMEPDEAADVLGDISADRREDILEEMEPEEAEDIKELLTYEDQSAGGLMTTEYVAISRDMTAQQAIDTIRELEPSAETVYYLYVVDSSEHLAGVLSLRDLIVAKPETPIEDFMVTNVIHVHLGASVEEIAHMLSDYNLLAVPVVDDENRLQGIVTVDDALEEIMPEGRRRRIPKIWS
ncbi:MAG: CBS domain-containing protein [Armatimonadetes bacterium]|nr:CBS domain-containing protein [Armatimonadota bacterium]